MLDIKRVREDAAGVRERLRVRGKGDDKLIDDLLSHDQTRRKLLTEVEELKAERNRTSKEVGQLKSKGQDASEQLTRMKEVSARIGELDQEVAEVEGLQRDLLLRIPNTPHPSVPTGETDADNPVEREVGVKKAFDFEPKDHVDLGVARGLIEFEAAAKVSGSGFVVYTGRGARLERALINYLLDLHTTEHGYTEISPPFIVRGAAMEGTGQLPKFEEDMYRLGEDEMYLIPTAEVPVTNLHREEILAEADLPKAYAAYTPCFRREAGSAGKDTRGMIRMHQFDKVELVHIVRPESSYEVLETLTGHAEKVLQSLGLAYRVVTLCGGDLGFGAAKCYDLEVWAPGSQRWLEVSSCSNFEDFQARRMNLRYKGADGKNHFCHTLNGSGTALARLYIALLETHQQADGSICLPETLKPYLSCDVI
ncbi:MAG: serine--tRNA ligase [Verrucomicrobiota bacterium]